MDTSSEKSLLQDDDVIKTEEGLIFNPYNPNNREITVKDVETILKQYGLPGKIHNIELYKRAFVHRSYTKRPMIENELQNITIMPRPNGCLALKSKSFERMEFLGDGILEAITKYYLYRRFPKENEGFMTEKKIALVKNESIGRLAYLMNLNKWLIISKHAEEKKTRTNLKKLGCLFESFLGAVFLDNNKINVKDEEKWFENFFVTGPGFQMCQIFLENIFEKHIDWTDIVNIDDNYKNKLQVIIQKEFKTTPDYLEITEVSDEYGYNMGVYLCLGQHIHSVSCEKASSIKKYNSFKDMHQELEEEGHLFILLGSGSHKIKKKAEQIACKEAITHLN
jgi:dsRNA-specific ribonuclease